MDRKTYERKINRFVDTKSLIETASDYLLKFIITRPLERQNVEMQMNEGMDVSSVSDRRNEGRSKTGIQIEKTVWKTIILRN